ncbi:hypothetical protein GS501_04400 [Saccharibacter sp. 17.LH.SD]|uniref:hypothetical protein n=1 Tax=Saccharibacter sp. 17.LH.SD TaxID=2689393 RepID=UPI00136F1283|nr:hypothetical protein [Saccharibacter sp. 17.LH.SD]MXV44289.1 hypothetical protein [Saccharibacter sp. 17.LH.SD]
MAALSFYSEDGLPLFKPTPAYGRPLVYVPVLESMKFALREAMIEQKLINGALGERLGVSEVIIRRLHESKVSRVEEALKVVGLQPAINVSPAMEIVA